MAHAYKQVPVRPDHAWSAVVGVLDPDGEVRYFLSRTLLFGQTAAVYQYNRVSRAIAHIARVWFYLLITNYVDDYPMLEVEGAAESARTCMTKLCDLLGWELSADPKKDRPFEQAPTPTLLPSGTHLHALRGLAQPWP